MYTFRKIKIQNIDNLQRSFEIFYALINKIVLEFL
jgi:hypothetical protein